MPALRRHQFSLLYLSPRLPFPRLPTPHVNVLPPDVAPRPCLILARVLSFSAERCCVMLLTPHAAACCVIIFAIDMLEFRHAAADADVIGHDAAAELIFSADYY